LRQYFALLLGLAVSLVSLREAHADCIDDPTAACLIELALVEADRARGTDEFKLNGDRLLNRLGSIQAATGDIAGAARTGSQIGAERGLDIHGEPMLDIGAQELLFFVADVLIKHRPSSADLTPIRGAAQALLEAAVAAPISKRTSSTEGHAAHILALSSSTNDARSALDNAVRRFFKAIDAGNNDILPAADDLISAAIALKDFAVAREIVGMISKEEMGKPGISPDYPGWTNQSARRVLASAEETTNSRDAGQKDSILDLITNAQIRSNDVAETIKNIHEMQSAISLEPLDPSISALAKKLKEISQEATFLPSNDPSSSDNLKIGIALAFLSAGYIPSTEALVAEITDSGRAQILIQLAMVRVRKGEVVEARRLLDEARQALAVEQNPGRQVDFNVEMALVLLELNDRKGVEAAIDKARANLEGIDDPMLQFQEAAGVAAVQWKLNHPEEAIATLAKVTGDSPGDVVFGRVLSAGFLAKRGYVDDARAILSRALRDALSGEPIDPLGLAYLYGEAADVLTTGHRN
jgi:tetratricopeptide (TPR) repeat protein